jgi:UPF0755 protein
MDGVVTGIAPAEAPAAPLPRGHARSAAKRRWRIALLCAGVLVLVLVGWFVLQAYPIGGPGKAVYVQVHDGESVSQISSTLASQGVLSSAFAFRLDLMVAGTPSVDPGWYEFHQSSSFPTVRSVLAGGPNARVLAVEPGQTLHEMANALSNIESASFASQFLGLATSGAVHSTFQPTPSTSLEGMVGTGLYLLGDRETPTLLLESMTARFERNARGLGLTPATTKRGLDAYELLTVASIVEKEGYYPVNMPRTATVIFNRLERGMPLQMDSTVEYALNQDGGPVTHATESYVSPYNTYLNTGLTPTPVCSPSSAAILATLHAPRGPWLYFVLVSQDGTMAFSSTYAQQLANERLAQGRGLP